MASRVKPKVEKPAAAPLEMVPAPSLTPVVELDIKIDSSNIGAFRDYMKLRKKVAAVNLKSVDSIGEMVDGIVEYLVQHGGCSEAALNRLSFDQLTGTLAAIGAVFVGVEVPQAKSAS